MLSAKEATFQKEGRIADSATNAQKKEEREFIKRAKNQGLIPFLTSTFAINAKKRQSITAAMVIVSLAQIKNLTLITKKTRAHVKKGSRLITRRKRQKGTEKQRSITRKTKSIYCRSAESIGRKIKSE